MIATHQAPQARPQPRAPQPPLSPAFDALLSIVLNTTGNQPRRASRMTGKPEPKYIDLPSHSPIDRAAHWDGRVTYACTLDVAGYARAGCRDYDEGGERLAAAALAELGRLGYTGFAIVIGNRAHVWALFREPAPIRAITGLLGRLPGARGELYPGNNTIRLPFGLHRIAQTRGMLLTMGGARYDLDDPQEREQAARACVALRLNDPPPALPDAPEPAAGGAWGADYDPAHWIALPDGAALMRTARYRALFAARPQLRALAAGERLTLHTANGPDDSDSVQLSILVHNLLTTAPKGRQPGQGAPPLREIRAVALHWYPKLRPGRSREHVQSDVDHLITRYMPPAYAPEPTKGIAAQPPATPEPAEPTAPSPKRPPPKQAAERLIPILATLTVDAFGRRLYHTDHLALALGVSRRVARLYLSTLVAQGQVARGQYPGPGGAGWVIVWGDHSPTTTPEAPASAAEPPAAPAEANPPYLGGSVVEPTICWGDRSAVAPVAPAETANRAQCMRDTPRFPSEPLAPATPDPAPQAPPVIAHLSLAGPDAPLADRVQAALDLVGLGRPDLVRLTVESETGPIDDRAFALAYAGVLDRRRLAAADAPTLRREAKKRRRRAERQDRSTPDGDRQFWALHYAAERAESALLRCTSRPPAPDDGVPDALTRAGAYERQQAGHIRAIAQQVRSTHQARRRQRGQLDQAIYAPLDLGEPGGSTPPPEPPSIPEPLPVEPAPEWGDESPDAPEPAPVELVPAIERAAAWLADVAPLLRQKTIAKALAGDLAYIAYRCPDDLPVSAIVAAAGLLDRSGGLALAAA